MKTFLRKIYTFCELRVSKLSVFHQILLLILLMIIFFGVEGYISVKTISTIQVSFQNLYGKMSGSANELNISRLRVEQIRNDYLATLAQVSFFGIGLQNGREYAPLDNITAKIRLVNDITEQEKEEVLKLVEEVRQILSQPINTANYQLLDKKLLILRNNLERLYMAVINQNNNIMEDTNTLSFNLMTLTIIIISISILIAVSFGLFIARLISIPLRKVVNSAKCLASGDLTQKIEMVGPPEITEAINSLNRATESLRNLVGKTIDESEQLINASRELRLVSNETGRSMFEIAKATEELAIATSEQVNQINEAVSSIQILSDMVTKVTNDTGFIADDSKKVADSADLGQKATHDIIMEINELFISTQEVANVIDELSKSSGEISNITALIQGIAEQTTLLSLNASIEAARAGEQGKGFAVVARETAKLAEQSKQSANHISELVLQMGLRTEHAVGVMQRGISRTELGKNLANEATVTFNDIFISLTNTLAKINQVAEYVKSMAENNKKVIDNVTTIASISEENMASTEEVSATVQETSASGEEVSAMAENLSRIAADLRESVSVFKL